MTDIPSNIKAQIFQMVTTDLKPAALVVAIKTGLAVLLGGLVSLMVCGQFGFGMTPFAISLNHQVHQNFGELSCAFICGSIFAFFPMAVLKIISPPLQFIALVRHKWYINYLWFSIVGVLLVSYDNSLNTYATFIFWFIGAMLIYHLLGFLFGNVFGHRPLQYSSKNLS